jgi:hypothetical protein
MILISLMLATSPAPAAKPSVEPRREVARPRPVSSATRSKRLIELEAAAKSLSLAAAESDRASGPEGM